METVHRSPRQRNASDRDSPISHDAVIDARDYSTDALLAMAETFAIDAADDDAGWPGEVGRHLASERLRVIRAELARRERLARLHAELPTPSDERYAEWVELARIVRERVDIVEVFVTAGYQLHDTGPSEAHAACLVCGGDDRLVIRRDPPGRVWCRQCGWSGDTITVAMSLRQCDFRDAVRWLAELAGVDVPGERPRVRAVLTATASQQPSSRRPLRVREVRHARA